LQPRIFPPLQTLTTATEFNPPTDYAGTHILYQDVAIPPNATSILLQFRLYYENFAEENAQRQGGFTDPFANPTLDYSNFNNPNQQIRVDIMNPAAPITAVNADDPAGNVPRVIQNLIQTTGSSAGTLIDGVGAN